MAIGQQADAIQGRHIDVRDYDAGPVAVQGRADGAGICAVNCVQSFQFKQLHQHCAYVVLIIND